MTEATDDLELFNDPVTDGPHPMDTVGGQQKVYRFDNGYGASVVRAREAGGLSFTYTDEDEWELAVIKFNSEDDDDFDLTYDTHITDDVIVHLTDEEVEEILRDIKKLEVQDE